MRGTKDKTAVLMDRHPLWLDAMAKLVGEEGIEVVGQATDTDDAISMIEEHRPDVFIAGIDTRRSEDFACVKAATRAHPDIRSVVVADEADPEAITSAFAAGAAVYCI